MLFETNTESTTVVFVTDTVVLGIKTVAFGTN